MGGVSAVQAEVAAAVDYTGGSMVCLFIDQTTAADIAVYDGQPPDDLHITLAFLPEGVDEPESVAARLFDVAQMFYPLAGQIGGLGMFADSGEGVPVIALPDVPGLSDFRTAVAAVLEDAGVVVADNHGWLPHVTLAYGATTMDANIVGTPIQFGELSLVVGAERWDLPFGGPVVAADRYPESQGGHEHGWGLGPEYKFREDQMVGRPGGVAQVGRKFDPSKHPREPSGSDKGGQWAAKIGLTPFRPGDEPAGFYDSDKFRAFDKSIAETAKRYDVVVDGKDKVSGFWEGDLEPSLALDVHDGVRGVRLFAEDLRGQWDQDAVLMFHEDRAGDSFAFRTKAKGDIAGALSAAGISGATIYPDGFEVFGDADEAARVMAVADALGIDHWDVKVRAGSLSFAERPLH